MDFSSAENDAPPSRVVAMNCSIVYCFTEGASVGFVFLGSGVCLVSRALCDTSGFRCSRRVCAHANEKALAAIRAMRPNKLTFFEFMDFVKGFALSHLAPTKAKLFALNPPPLLVKSAFAVDILPWVLTKSGSF